MNKRKIYEFGGIVNIFCNFFIYRRGGSRACPMSAANKRLVDSKLNFDCDGYIFQMFRVRTSHRPREFLLKVAKYLYVIIFENGIKMHIVF